MSRVSDELDQTELFFEEARSEIVFARSARATQSGTNSLTSASYRASSRMIDEFRYE